MPKHGSAPLPGSEQGAQSHSPNQSTLTAGKERLGGPGSGVPAGIGQTVQPLPGTSAGKPASGPGGMIVNGSKK